MTTCFPTTRWIGWWSGLADLSDRGLLGRDEAEDLTDRVHRVGPHGSHPGNVMAIARRWWNRRSCAR